MAEIGVNTALRAKDCEGALEKLVDLRLVRHVEPFLRDHPRLSCRGDDRGWPLSSRRLDGIRRNQREDGSTAEPGRHTPS